MHQLEIVEESGRWICRLPGPEQAVVIGDTRENVAEFLLLLDCVWTGKNGAIYVSIKPRKGRHHAGINAAAR